MKPQKQISEIRPLSRKDGRERTVIKIGGSLLKGKQFSQLISGLSPYLRKHQTIIVHGGGNEISNYLNRLGIKNRFLKGRRFTDKKVVEIVEMVLSGKVNPCLVSQLNALQIPALGLSGRNAGLIKAKRIKSLGQVGLPIKVRSDFIQSILSIGFVPVFASVASDGNGNALNVNADEMASTLAIALKVHRLILFTDVPGILDPSGKTISHITPESAQTLIKKKVIGGGMIPKIESAIKALDKGVKEVWILQGKLPLLKAQGTLLIKRPPLSQHPFR